LAYCTDVSIELRAFICLQEHPLSADAATPDTLSFDAALAQLEELARQLEEGDIPLEDALEVYERAVQLFRHCRQRLEGVEHKLETLTRDLDELPEPATEGGDGGD